MNRIATAIDAVRPKLAALDAAKRDALDANLAVEFDEHFTFQSMQARAHAEGKLATDEALIVYAALGELGSDSNGGWAAGTDTATKVVVTQLMGEMLARR
jgi:hypothetical protein